MTDGPVTPPPAPPSPPGSSNLFTRVIGIVTNPAGEWRKIDGEATSLMKLVTTYTVILAAILPIAFIVGVLIAGAGGGMGTLILIAVIYYAFQVGVPIALAFIVDALAPSFGSTKNATQAAKLAVYSSTPMHLAGILFILAANMFTGLQWLPILIGLGWGGFLLFLGLPILMRTPPDKAPGYAGASIGAWAVLWVIAQVIINAIVWNMIINAAYSAAAAAAARYSY